MSVTITGMKQVKLNLKQLDGNVKQAIKTEVTRTAVNVQGHARQAAPVDTGRYRSSIAWAPENPDGTSALVGTNNKIAPFLEFGTGPAGRDSRHSQLAREAMADLGYVHGPKGGLPPLEVIERWAHLKGIPVEEAWAIRWAIREQGSPAKPHLIPALEVERPHFADRIETALRRATRDAGK